MDYKLLTEQYYANWMGLQQFPQLKPGEVQFVYSQERNQAQYGYSSAFEIWGLWFGDRGIISYGDKAKAYVENLKGEKFTSLEEVCSMLQKKSGQSVNLGIKYVYEGIERTAEKARVLESADYDAYAQFFALDGGCDEWLREYFEELVEKKQCCGVFQDGKLVSCTDAPGMPYMADTVQEIGINTLKEYCGKGFATEACLMAIGQCIQQGRCPMWSTGSSNVASQRLAEAVGLVKFADCIMVTEE